MSETTNTKKTLAFDEDMLIKLIEAISIDKRYALIYLGNLISKAKAVSDLT